MCFCILQLIVFFVSVVLRRGQARKMTRTIISRTRVGAQRKKWIGRIQLHPKKPVHRHRQQAEYVIQNYVFLSALRCFRLKKSTYINRLRDNYFFTSIYNPVDDTLRNPWSCMILTSGSMKMEILYLRQLSVRAKVVFILYYKRES